MHKQSYHHLPTIWSKRNEGDTAMDSVDFVTGTKFRLTIAQDNQDGEAAIIKVLCQCWNLHTTVIKVEGQVILWR